jgi:hypothetical protein
MKHIASLLLGMLVGVILFGLVLVYNPFVTDRGLSPLSVTDAQVISLNYSVVPAESIVFTNDGESMHDPHPAKVLQLWEAPIRQTSAMVSLLHDARSRVAGVGVKVSSLSESSRLFNGDAIVDSVWYIFLPGNGSMFIQQTENYWPFLQNVAFPAWRSSANSWRGRWLGNLTAGPGALGTAPASGSSGRFAGLEMEAVESLSVDAFSSDHGFISAEGRLLIALPESAAGSAAN